MDKIRINSPDFTMLDTSVVNFAVKIFQKVDADTGTVTVQTTQGTDAGDGPSGVHYGQRGVPNGQRTRT